MFYGGLAARKVTAGCSGPQEERPPSKCLSFTRGGLIRGLTGELLQGVREPLRGEWTCTTTAALRPKENEADSVPKSKMPHDPMARPVRNNAQTDAESLQPAVANVTGNSRSSPAHSPFILRNGLLYPDPSGYR